MDIRKSGRKIVELFTGFCILWIFLLLGQWISGWLPFVVPGSVVGMILIFIALSLGIVKLEWINLASMTLLGWMGLFFVPYGVGITDAWSLVDGWGVYVVIIALVASVLTFMVSGKLFDMLKRKA